MTEQEKIKRARNSASIMAGAMGAAVGSMIIDAVDIGAVFILLAILLQLIRMHEADHG